MFIFGMNEKMNFSVDPFAGSVGLDSYDSIPALSAFLMAFHKYGLFALFAVYSTQVNHTTTSEDKRTVLYLKDLRNWFSDHMTASIMLFSMLTTLGYYLLNLIANKFHPMGN
jgi:hypothetical protein